MSAASAAASAASPQRNGVTRAPLATHLVRTTAGRRGHDVRVRVALGVQQCLALGDKPLDAVGLLHVPVLLERRAAFLALRMGQKGANSALVSLGAREGRRPRVERVARATQLPRALRCSHLAQQPACVLCCRPGRVSQATRPHIQQPQAWRLSSTDLTAAPHAAGAREARTRSAQHGPPRRTRVRQHAKQLHIGARV